MPSGVLFAFEDEDALARDHEEVLLIRFAVVHAVRLARWSTSTWKPTSGNSASPSSTAVSTERVASPPEDVARVDHEPALALGQEPRLGLLQLGFGNAGHGSHPPRYADRSLLPERAYASSGFEVSSDTLASYFAATSLTA